MDLEMLASRVHPTNHITYASAPPPDNYLSAIDRNEDNELKASFPCPFCYLDIELSLLRIHLQDEHCFDLKNAVCPVCAANLGKDMIGHFIVQHSNMLKRMKKMQQASTWSSINPTLGKELRGSSSFVGDGSLNGRVVSSDATPDPLLSPFLCGVVLPDSTTNEETSCANNNNLVTEANSVSACDLCDEDQEAARQRAEFIQQLMFSTIF